VRHATVTLLGPVSLQNMDGGECTTKTTPFHPAWANQNTAMKLNLLVRLNHASTHMLVLVQKTLKNTSKSMAPTPGQLNTTKRAIGKWVIATAVLVALIKMKDVACAVRAGKDTNEQVRVPIVKNVPTQTQTVLCFSWGLFC